MIGFLAFCLIFSAVLAVIIFVPAVYARVYLNYEKSVGDDKREKIRATNVRLNVTQSLNKELRLRLILVLGMSLLASVLSIYSVLSASADNNVSTLNRPEFGEGEKNLNIVALTENDQYPITIFLAERTPDEAQVQAFFEERFESIKKIVLGDNISFDQVRENLNLISGLTDGCEIEWTIGNPDLISITGELSQDIPGEGQEVELGMVISYADFTRSFEISVTVWPRVAQINEKDELESFVNEAVKAQSDMVVTLPEEYGEVKIGYRNPEDNTINVLCVLTIIAGILIWISRDSRLDEHYRLRNLELEADYPVIVSRLCVLFCAGLTIPNAVERLCADYEKNLQQKKRQRAGFEELLITARVLKVSGYKKGIFESFGKRCSLYCYRRLGSILEQSMRLGTLDLKTFLEQEAITAFELKKQAANKLGEEAGTKLLIPMMISFVMVLALVVVPAWSGMNF